MADLPRYVTAERRNVRRRFAPWTTTDGGLLNPGPACTSRAGAQALLRGDLCHRQSEFSALLLGARPSCARRWSLSPEYGVPLVTGSGTAAMEMAVVSAVRPGRALLVVNNGVYGERLAAIARAHGIATEEVRAAWTELPPLDQVRRALASRDDIDAVAAVHHETTTGLLNPAAEIGAIARAAGVPLILDAISSMCCDPLDARAVGADFLLGTANKGLHALPGISFVAVSPLGRQRVDEVTPRSLYLHLGSYLASQERGDVPFTPAVQICYALDEALDELAERGGVAARVADYAARAELVRQGFSALGLQSCCPGHAPLQRADRGPFAHWPLLHRAVQPPEGAWLHHLRRTGHAGQPGVPRGHHGRTIAGDPTRLPARAGHCDRPHGLRCEGHRLRPVEVQLVRNHG